MNASDVLGMSWGNLRRRKGRTFLTLAGVTIGVAALVLMVSLGLGLQRELVRLFSTEDSLRTLSVMRVKAESGEKPPEGFFALLGLESQFLPVTEKDLEQIRAIPGVLSAFPDFNMVLQILVETAGGVKRRGAFQVGGAAPEEHARFAAALVKGEIAAPGPDRTCLVPTSFATQLKLSPDALLGAKVRFKALVGGAEEEDEEPPWRLTGVLDSKKLGLFADRVYLPLDQATALYETKGGNPFMAAKKGSWLQADVRVADSRRIDEVAGRLRNSGYTVLSSSDIVDSINMIFLIVKGVFACIGVIGLVVSLFGIANTMATAVLERTREIGIMKALGARDRDIGRLFLAEAATLGALGGGLGLAAASLAGALLNLAVRGLWQIESLFYVSTGLAAGAVVFAVAVSVLAGWLPARRAARMEPVAALRFE